MDTNIKNGRIVTPRGMYKGGISIERGKIVGISRDHNLPQADEVIDAEGNIVIPGAIDSHVHIHIPSLLHRENFKNGTIAAAAGGTTTIADFVHEARASTIPAFSKRKIDGERLCTVDFFLHVYINNDKQIGEIPKLVDKGAFSFKAQMTSGGPGGLPWLDSGQLLDFFRAVRETGSIATVHAEDESICERLGSKMRKEGKKDVLSRAESRPSIAEAEAISRAIILAQEESCPIHIFHVSSGKGVDIIRSSRAKGERVTSETCPHYLLFSKLDFRKLGSHLNVLPTIKSRTDQQQLWSAIRDGTIDIVVSDHFAPLKKEKESSKNIWEDDGGIPGIETRVMLMMSEGVNKNRISLDKFVEVLCTSPAKIFGLYPQKGIIQVGSDADIVIIDTKKELKIKAGNLHQNARWTPWEGKKVKGIPTHTIVRGKSIMKGREIYDEPGYGKFVSRLSS